MKNKRPDFSQIQSFSDLEEEKTKLYYQMRYSQKKIELNLLELGYILHPARLIPSLISDWTRPLIKELKLKLRDLIFSRKKRRKSSKREEG